MVFGNIYCPLSRLEIKDGDRCMLIALGFEMKHDFGSGDQAGIGHFMNPYIFLPREPIEVTFEGNYWQIQYDQKINKDVYKNQEYKEHELYMLVHLGFYKEIQKHAPIYMGDKIKGLHAIEELMDVWEKAHEIQHDVRDSLSFKLAKDEISKDEFMERVYEMKTPDWIVELFKLAHFMRKMNMIPYANCGSDQHQTGEDFEKWREAAKVFDNPTRKKNKKV